jgi:hypothetical protein
MDRDGQRCDFCEGEGTVTLLSSPTGHRYCHDRNKLRTTIDVCAACLTFIDRTEKPREGHRGFTRCPVCHPLDRSERTAVRLEREAREMPEVR